MKDLKYLFAYSIPLVTLISVHFKGIFSYTAPIYAFIFIPILDMIIVIFRRLIIRQSPFLPDRRHHYN